MFWGARKTLVERATSPPCTMSIFAEPTYVVLTYKHNTLYMLFQAFLEVIFATTKSPIRYDKMHPIDKSNH